MSDRYIAARFPLPAGAARNAEESAPERGLPGVVAELLASAPESRDVVWERFTAEYSFLLLHVARKTASTRDEAMDAYAQILEELRSDDLRRLRGYAAHPRSKFTTWLVVVARRICVDHYRARYGRRRETASSDSEQLRRSRRALEDLVSAEVDLDSFADSSTRAPDAKLLRDEMLLALRTAVARLSPADQLLLRLRFGDDSTAAHIARLLRMPSPFHVYRRINAVLATLREALAAAGVRSADP